MFPNKANYNALIGGNTANPYGAKPQLGVNDILAFFYGNQKKETVPIPQFNLSDPAEVQKMIDVISNNINDLANEMNGLVNEAYSIRSDQLNAISQGIPINPLEGMRLNNIFARIGGIAVDLKISADSQADGYKRLERLQNTANTTSAITQPYVSNVSNSGTGTQVQNNPSVENNKITELETRLNGLESTVQGMPKVIVAELKNQISGMFPVPANPEKVEPPVNSKTENQKTTENPKPNQQK